MLILIEPLLSEEIAAWLSDSEECEVPVCAFPSGDDLSFRNIATGELLSWAHYVEACIRRNEPLRILIGVQEPGPVLDRILDQLNHESSRPIHISLLFASSSPQSIWSWHSAPIQPRTNTSIASCWFVGARDSERKRIAPGTATRAASEWIFYLSKQRAIAEKTQLFENTNPGSSDMVAWGWRSWLPDWFDILGCRAQAIRAAAEQDIPDNDAHSNQAKNLSALASSSVAKAVQISIPHDVRDMTGIRLSSLLPPPPVHVFGKGFAEVVRDSLTARALDIIQSHRSIGIQYKASLCTALADLGTQCRQHGQKTLEEERRQCFALLENMATLGGAPLLVSHFFKQLPKPSSPPSAPCSPSNLPDDAECVRRFTRPLAALVEEHAINVPTQKDWIRAISATAVVIVLAYFLGNLGLDTRHRLLIGAVAFAPPLWLLVKARRSARRLHKSLVTAFEAAATGLRAEYAEKVEWLIDRIGRTFEAQFLSDLRASGRRIEWLYARLNPKIEDSQGGRLLGAYDDLESEGADEIRSIADELRDKATSILRKGLSDATHDTEALVAYERLLAKTDRVLIRKFAQRSWPTQETEECLGLTRPTFMAFSPNHFASVERRKFFLLPGAERSKGKDLQRHVKNGTQVEFVYGPFPAAAVLHLRRRLEGEELKLALGVEDPS